MVKCIVTVVVLLSGILCASLEDSAYILPEPEIEVIHPKGFSISIDDSPGINLIVFYVNIVRLEGNGNDKNFSKYVRRQNNGKWSFIRQQARINTGDKIKYSVFAVKRGEGFASKSGECKVEEMESPYRVQGKAGTNLKICKTSDKPPTVSETDEPETADDAEYYLNICEQAILNTTKTLISLESQVTKLNRTNQELIKAIEKYPDAKQLTLRGQYPSVGGAVTTVQFVLTEKLGLNPGIMSAVKNADNSIMFTVQKLTDKVDILEAAEQDLKNSKIIIE